MRIADDVVHLGLAEHLVDRDAERFLRPCENRRSDRLAGAHDAAKVDVEPIARPRERLHHQLERRGEQERVAYLIFLDQSKRALGVESSAIADDGLAEMERRKQ